MDLLFAHHEVTALNESETRAASGSNLALASNERAAIDGLQIPVEAKGHGRFWLEHDRAARRVGTERAVTKIVLRRPDREVDVRPLIGETDGLGIDAGHDVPLGCRKPGENPTRFR